MRGYFTDDIASYSKGDCEEYIRRNPNGKYILEVEKRLGELHEAAAESERKAAEQRLADARRAKEDERFWNNCKNSLDGINKYKATYPQGNHIGECDSRVEKLKEKAVRQQKTEEHVNSIASDCQVICGIIGLIIGIFGVAGTDAGFKGIVGMAWIGCIIGYGVGWVIGHLF